MFKKLLSDRLGMFVHFGIYSAYGGFVNGKKSPLLGEWIQNRSQIPIADYEAFGRKNFCPAPDFAKNLARAAKEAGMRYIVLTSKHHDGFCLFKSSVSDYTTYGFFGRDICRELSDACKEEGLGLGLYYSQCLDWHEKNAGGNYESESGKKAQNRNWWDFPDDNIDFEKYFREKCIPQVKEILTNYGDLKLIWFDFPHDITKEQSEELRTLVKSLQPNCLINSRIGNGCSDYDSLGDNGLPVAPVDVDLECLVTLNDTWGYRSDDNNWKTSEEVAGILCRCLTSDATLLCNVGPMADGSLTAETHEILKGLGVWTKRNAEAIYSGICGNPLPITFSFGQLATKDNCIFLYVNNKNLKTVEASGFGGNIKSVTLLGSDTQIDYEYSGRVLKITQPKTEFEIPVYKVEFYEKPDFDKVITCYENSVSLGILQAHKVRKGSENATPEKLFYERSTNNDSYKKHGLAVTRNILSDFWTDSDEIMCWDVNFTKSGTYSTQMVHGIVDVDWNLAELKSNFTLSLAGQKNPVNLNEEKSRFRISKSSEINVRIARDCGDFKIEKPGIYRVFLSHDDLDSTSLVSYIQFDKID